MSMTSTPGARGLSIYLFTLCQKVAQKPIQQVKVLFLDRRNAAGSVTETAPKWQLLGVKKSPLRYCQFRAGARDIRYNVVIAVEKKKKRTKKFSSLVLTFCRSLFLFVCIKRPTCEYPRFKRFLL